jgi:uncharacterized membrane protein
MWFFTFAPDWVTHLIFAVGLIGILVGFLLNFIPFVKPYKLAIQVISLLIFTFGVYLQGGLADNKEWELKASQLKAQIAEMEANMAKADVQVVEKVVTKKQVIREKGQQVIKYVDREVVKYDTKFVQGGECEIPKDVFKVYNDSLGIESK